MTHTERKPPRATPGDAGGREGSSSMVRDEVCGMRISGSTAPARAVLDGKTFYFCSVRCRDKFSEHPDWYVPVGP